LRLLRLGGLLVLVLLVSAACSLLGGGDLVEPSSVPPGFQAVPGGSCGVAFPSDWKRDALAEGELLYEGTAGRGSLHQFTELDPTRPEEPLPKFVGFYARTAVQVSARQAIQVPGAEAAFQLRLAGADGSTHLVVYGHDSQRQAGCWVLVTPADATAEQVARTLRVGEG